MICNYGILTSIILLEVKNILISFEYTTKYWDLNNNFESIKSFNNFMTFWNIGL